MPQYITGYYGDSIELDDVVLSTIFQEVYGNYESWGFKNDEFIKVLTIFEHMILMKCSPTSKEVLTGVHKYDEISYKHLITRLKGYEIQELFRIMYFFINSFNSQLGHSEEPILLKEIKAYEAYRKTTRV